MKGRGPNGRWRGVLAPDATRLRGGPPADVVWHAHRDRDGDLHRCRDGGTREPAGDEDGDDVVDAEFEVK